MTNEERLHGLIFHGLQEFDGKFPPYGLFTDPLTHSTFSVGIDEPIGPALDRLREVWERDLGDTMDDAQAMKDLDEDRKYQDSKER